LWAKDVGERENNAENTTHAKKVPHNPKSIAFDLRENNPDISVFDIIHELTERGFFSEDGDPFT